MNHFRESRQLSAALIVLIIAIIGTYLLIGSHAATPFASLNADQGSLAGCATTQTDSGGTYVKFDCGNGSTGGGNSPACSSTTRYNTVAAAAAAVASAPAGSVICMTAGSYGSITFSGTHSGTVTIEPDPAQDPTAAGKVVFSGIDITGSNITVHNFYSTGGITLGTGDSFITIDHNDITGGSEGITNPQDEDCTVGHAPGSGCGKTAGIANITVSGNSIHGYGAGGGEDALHFNNWNNLHITANEIYGLAENGGHTDGFQSVWGGRNVTFDHNYEHDNQSQGFFTKDGDVTGAIVKDNLFVRNNNLGDGEFNIQIFDASGVVIQNNTSWANANDVLRSDGGPSVDNATVDHNVMQLFKNGCPNDGQCADGQTTKGFALTEDYDIFKTNPTTFTKGPNSTVNSNPAFLCGSSCGAVISSTPKKVYNDDYRLASNPNGIGIDWTPSQYTYGPIQ